MKILHAAETLKGGPATIIRQLATAQSASGGEIHLVLPNSHADEMATVPSLTLHRFTRKRRTPVAMSRFAFCFVLAFIRVRPDVVHLHSSFAGAICRPLLVVLRGVARSKVVYSPHCWAFIATRSDFKRKIFGLIEAALSRWTDVIVCGSAYERLTADRYEMKCDIEVVRCSVEPPLMGPALPSLRSDGRKQFTYIGRLDMQKGLDILLEAARQLNPHEYHFCVVGEFVRESGELPAIEHVDYLPWQDRTGLASIFRSSTAVVMPSRWESFGLVAVEAMSYGVPVVASDCCSLPEIVKDGQNGWLFRSGDVDDLVAVLQRITIEEARALSSACYETYVLRYSSSEMTEHHARIYAALLGAGYRGGERDVI